MPRRNAAALVALLLPAPSASLLGFLLLSLVTLGLRWG